MPWQIIVMKAHNWYLRKFGWIPRPVRRIIVFVIGGTVLLIALLGIILPILPGWIFLPVALAILALEFAWAGTWLLKIRRTARNMQDRVRDGFSGGKDGQWPARWVARTRYGWMWMTCRITGRPLPDDHASIPRQPHAPPPGSPLNRGRKPGVDHP